MRILNIRRSYEEDTMIRFTLMFIAVAIAVCAILLTLGLIKSAGMVSRAEEEIEARRVDYE